MRAGQHQQKNEIPILKMFFKHQHQLFSKYLHISVFLFFVFSLSVTGQNKPLLDDYEIAKAIQKEMEAWGEKVSISDAFQITRMLGISQGEYGGVNTSSVSSELFHSKVTNNKNIPVSGLSIANQMLGKSLGNVQMVNAVFDGTVGITLKEIPYYKYINMGKEGVLETNMKIGTYDAYPQKLSSFFTAINWASYCYHVSNTLYDLPGKGIQKSSYGSYIKVVTGGISLAAGTNVALVALGGPATLFIGAAIWIFDTSIDVAQANYNRVEEDLAYGDYRIFYLEYNNNKGINWVQRIQSGTWSDILITLREYWKADLTSKKNGAQMEERRNFVKGQYDNYEDHFAYKFVNEFIVPDIVGFFQREAVRAKEEAIQSLKDYIASLYEKKAIIRMKLAYQSQSGQKMEVFPPIKLTITDLYEKEEMNELFYDVKVNGSDVEIKIDKLEYLKWLTKHEGFVFFKIETEIEGKTTQHLMSPNWIKPALGEDGDGHPVRTQITDDNSIIIVDVPIEVNVPTYRVNVQVIGVSGDKLKGIRIQGPDGQRVETNASGEALINVPTIGKSWVYEVDEYGGLNGGKAELPNKINNVLVPTRVILKSLIYEPKPPMPSFARLDISQIQNKVETTIGELESGNIDIKSAKRIIDKSVSSIEIKLRDYGSSYENSKNLYMKRAAADEMPQEKVFAFIKAKRELYDLDHKQAWDYKEELGRKIEKVIKGWDKDLEQILSEIKIMTDQLIDLNAIVQKDAKIFNQNSSRTVYYLTPHIFRELGIVELEMETVDKLKKEIEKILDRTKINQPLIEAKSKQLENKLIELSEFRETVNFSKNDYRYREAVNSTVNADYALGVIEMFIDLDGIETVINELDKAHSVLSWIQLRALGHVELMKKYTQLIENMPAELENSNPLFANLEELKKNVGLVGASVVWASGKEKENRRKHFVDPDKVPIGHNGYGVDAWQPYSEAKKAWGSIQPNLAKTAIIAENWSQEVDTLRKQIITQIEEMDNGGWIVEDIKRALNNSLGKSVTGLNYNIQLRGENTQMQERLNLLDKEFERSIVTVLATLDKAWSDANKYKPILQKALTAARNGDLKGAETTLKGASQLVPYEASINTNRGNVNFREVLLDRESYEMEQELNNLLLILKRDEHTASLAHLIIDVTGGGFNDLSVQVLDKDNNKQSNWNGNSCTLTAGQYRVQFTSLGNRVIPAEQQINLAKGETKTIVVEIKKPIDNGQSIAGTGNMGDFNFENVKKRVFAYNVCMSMRAPAWSTDSKIVVTEGKGIEGLLAFDLEKNETWQITTKTPLPPARYKEATIVSSFPKVIGNSVVHKMDMVYQWAPGTWSREMYWMVVPLNGGQSSAIEKELPSYYRIVDIRQVNGELEYLLLGEINAEKGVFLLKTGAADYKDAQLLHKLKEWNVRFFVSPDWKLICIGDLNYQKGYEIYELGGNKIANLPQSLLHTFTFSPDGKYIAGHQRLDKAPWNQIVVFPVNNNTKINIVDSGAIRYDEIAWSPNGRYLAYQRRRENPDYNKGEVEFVIADIMAKGASLAEGGAITRSRTSFKNNLNQSADVKTPGITNNGTESNVFNSKEEVGTIANTGSEVKESLPINNDFSSGTINNHKQVSQSR